MEKNIYSIIQDWHKLLENGTINENEFLTKKNELLNTEKIIHVAEPINKKKVPILKLSIILGVVLLASIYIYYHVKAKDSDYTAEQSDTETDTYQTELENYLAESDNDKYGTYDQIADNFGSYQVNGVVTDRAYFHEEPDLTTKKKSYLTDIDNFKVEKINRDFGYVEFTNSKGNVTKGWLNMEELKPCDHCQ